MPPWYVQGLEWESRPGLPLEPMPDVSPFLYQAINVTIGSSVYSMTLHLGVATRGTYTVDLPQGSFDSGCAPYFFQAANAAGFFRFPETGQFHTTMLGGCTRNWSPSPGVPTPAPTPPQTQPTTSPTPAPTFDVAVR